LYQLTVEEFDLFNGDLRFKNAFFSPTSNNREKESFFISQYLVTVEQYKVFVDAGGYGDAKQPRARPSWWTAASSAA
jgi:formylglycine-generating enzyme required for sulfatase activity